MDARLGFEFGNHLVRVVPAGDDAWIDERAGLNVMQPGFGEPLDHANLVGRTDRAGLDLEALARPFFVDLNSLREVGHGSCLSSCETCMSDFRTMRPLWEEAVERMCPAFPGG